MTREYPLVGRIQRGAFAELSQMRKYIFGQLDCAADGPGDRLHLPHQLLEAGRRQGLHPVG